MGPRLARVRRVLLGDRPRVVLLFLAPTLLAIVMDFALRGRSLLVFPPKEWVNYAGSSLASAGFWSGPLWLSSRLFVAKSKAVTRVGVGLFGALFVFPLAFFCYGGQALYFRVFGAYMARDTVRLGIALRGTLGAWLASWGASTLLMALVGLAVTAGFLGCARRAAAPLKSAWPIIPILAFSASSYCFWIDFVESRSLQAAPPDTCFIHGVMHAIRDGVTGKGWVKRGVSLRQPLPLPVITPPAYRPNVLVILTESVRADAICSSPKMNCKGRFLEDAAPDRVALGRLTTQSSGTFTSCVMLWTGLGPDNDFATMHHAPVLWEIAKATGYRTAYITSQNLRYDDFSAFVENAGIDVQASAPDLGGAPDPHVGAPDEKATARMLAYLKDAAGGPEGGKPYFAVLHFSNTHWPYRVDPNLQPFEPHDDAAFGDVVKLHNHYRNAVLLQERTVSAFLTELRAMPGWDDTVVIFLSDHGEEFREHGGLYHLTSLFEEQIRIPGFLVAGDHALTADQRTALAGWATQRTFSQDVHATLLDLLGVFDQHGGFPLADRVLGRSLVRPFPKDQPIVMMSTASGVWEPDDPKYGAMQGDMLAVRSAAPGWLCFDARLDPLERMTQQVSRCAPLIDAATPRFIPYADWKN